MGASRLILVTDITAAAMVADFLARAAPDLAIVIAHDLAGVERALAETPDARLLTVMSGVIVPDHLLRRLTFPAYNIHPGPPAFPGAHPDYRAAHAHADAFGATLHQITSAIDGGAIIAQETDRLTRPGDPAEAGEVGLVSALVLLGRFASMILTADAPLVPSGARWTGRTMSARAVEALIGARIGLSDLKNEPGSAD